MHQRALGEPAKLHLTDPASLSSGTKAGTSIAGATLRDYCFLTDPIPSALDMLCFLLLLLLFFFFFLFSLFFICSEFCHTLK